MTGALGRLHAPDERDYQARRVLAAKAEPIVRKTKYWAMFRRPLNQGSEGTCVGYGWRHWMLTAPVIQVSPTEEPLAVTIYDEATRVDEWPQNDGDRSFGTSVRAGAKALQARGLIASYAFAWDIDTVIDWLCVQGPVVIGVSWYQGFDQPDAEGVIRISGRVRGGHCVALTGWDNRRGQAYGTNSWGVAYGKRGRFRISGEDLARLLREDGEMATATEVRLP